MAVGEMRLARNPRRALLVISDGIDNHSRHTERELTRRLPELDLPIFAIDVHGRPSGNRFAIQRQNLEVLQTFSTLNRGA